MPYTDGVVIFRSRCINVLVSSNQLVVTLSKVLVFGLGELFPIENVYSAQKISKESCFERVLTKFGKKCTYVVIGSSEDDEKSCKAVNFPKVFFLPFEELPKDGNHRTAVHAANLAGPFRVLNGDSVFPQSRFAYPASPMLTFCCGL